MSYDEIESNICVLVLLNLLNLLQKEIKCLAGLTFDLFLPNSFNKFNKTVHHPMFIVSNKKENLLVKKWLNL